MYIGYCGRKGCCRGAKKSYSIGIKQNLSGAEVPFANKRFYPP